jgi:hypothetical protein
MKNVEPQRLPPATPQPIRKPVLILTMMIGLGAIALLFVFLKQGKLKDSTTNPTAKEAQTPQLTETSEVRGDEAMSPSDSPTVVPVANADPSDRARQLVKSLSEVNVQPGEMTPEKAEQWRRDLLDLVGQGKAAIPVLQEFFQKNEDVRFESASAMLGEPTLRVALLKVLFDLPTPENVKLEEQVLRTTTEPDEIVVLARQLRLQEPGKYRELIIEATRAALARARNGQLIGRDLKGLAEVLEYYGVPD